MRKIPATMATQHPDNAGSPYWETDGDGFVSIYEELRECLSAFDDLGTQEFLWDWEGKYADESVLDKLFSNHLDFCKRKPVGRDAFLTFRLPNIWHEKGYSLLRALMVILTSEDFARDLKLPGPPLFEVALPMTERADQITYIQDSFRKLSRFKSKTFNHHTNNDYLEVIPLVESVEGQLGIGKLLNQYFDLHKTMFKKRLPYLRPWLARSDPAIASGLLATVLANKVALAAIAEFSEHRAVPTYPIIGVGSLVFRGGLNPNTINDFLVQYGGIRTVTIQSAFRYDYPLAEVKQAVVKLNKELPKTTTQLINKADRKILQAVAIKSSKLYRSTLTHIIKDLEPIFSAVPRRRERKLHIGFLSYARKLGRLVMPRAINFAAGFYSLGVPPEFIGTGRSLAKLHKKELETVQTYYPNLKTELLRAGHWLNGRNLESLAKHNSRWQLVADDVKKLELLFSVRFGPETTDESLHANLAANVLLSKHQPKKLSELIAETGVLRKSLG